MLETTQQCKPPRQRRSRESMERYLDAAEAVIRESGFDNLTIAEVVRRAGYSIGGLYSRFPNKHALLEAVHVRFLTRTEAAIREELDAERDMHESLEDAVRRIVDVLLKHLLSERELFRAFIVEAMIDPHVRAGGEKANRVRRDCVAAALLVHRDEIGHPDPELAVGVCYQLCMAVLRERVIYGPEAELMGRFADEVLVVSLTRALTSFLKAHEP